jgi:FkbM family methyltransferase
MVIKSVSLNGAVRGIWMRLQIILSRTIDRPVRSQGVRIDLADAPISDLQRSLIAAGRYEVPEVNLVRKHIDPNTAVIELGGGVGVVTGIIGKNLNGSTIHITVEANQNLIPTLNKTIHINDINTKVIEGAYSADGSRVSLITDGDFSNAYTYESEGGGEVLGYSLDEITNQYNIENFILVSDIEGSEKELVAQEGKKLENSCKLAILESHPKKYDTNLLFNRMEEMEFYNIDSESNVHVFKNYGFE